MKCSKYQKLLSDWLDGNLSEKKQKKLELHLKECHFCQEYCQELKALDQAAKNIPEAEIGNVSEFEDCLRRRLSQIKGQREEKERKRRFKIPVPAWGFGLVFLAVIMYLIFYPRSADERDRQMQLVTLLSYEDSYLALTQAIATDEETIENLNEEIMNSIVQETMVLELDDSENFQTYQKQINEKDTNEYLPLENMGFEEGK